MAKICLITANSSTFGLLTGNPSTNVGGAELQQSLIAQALSAAGHEVSFLVHDFGQPDIMTNDAGVRLIKTFGLRDAGFLLKHVKPLRLFYGLERAESEIYYQRCSGFITGLAALWCKIRGRKFVFAAASDWDVDGTRERRMNPVFRVLYRYGVRSADEVLTQTERQKELVENRFKRSCRIIRNMYPMPPDDDAPRDYILWVSQFFRIKRPEMFLEIARRMPEQKFVMVGGPANGEEHIYEETVEASRDIPNLTITGALPYAEAIDMYRCAIAFVNTSIVEGFPNTYLDALSRRVPVVATFDPDEIICRHGLGFHCSSVEEMVSALKKLVEDEGMRGRMGESGRNYVKANHDIQYVGLEYDRLIKELMAGGSKEAGH